MCALVISVPRQPQSEISPVLRQPRSGSPEILALTRRAGFAIAKVGVAWTDDRRSRINPIKDMWKVVREAMTIRKNLKREVYHQAPARALSVAA